MHRTTIYLPDELHGALETLARGKGLRLTLQRRRLPRDRRFRPRARRQGRASRPADGGGKVIPSAVHRALT